MFLDNNVKCNAFIFLAEHKYTISGLISMFYFMYIDIDFLHMIHELRPIVYLIIFIIIVFLYNFRIHDEEILL